MSFRYCLNRKSNDTLSLMKLKHFIVLMGLSCLILYSCLRNPAVSPVLVKVDSLVNHGFYESADSLLDKYCRFHPSKEENDIMYRSLLSLSLKSKMFQPVTDLKDAKSLVDYYSRHGMQKELAVSYYCLGYVYQCLRLDDNALDAYQKALELSVKTGNLHLRGWLFANMGDIYMLQGMHHEMAKNYKYYYSNICLLKDTLRLPGALVALSRSYEAEGKTDSSVLALGQSIKLAERLGQTDQVENGKLELSGLYIQLGLYDKALPLLDNHPDFNICWGDYYKGKRLYGKAVPYYKEVLADSLSNISAKISAAKALSSIYTGCKNILSANLYLNMCIKLQDSLDVNSHEEETERILSLYNFNKEQKQKMALEQARLQVRWLTVLILSFVVVLTIFLIFRYKYNRQKLQIFFSKKRYNLLLTAMKGRTSLNQIKQNEQKIKSLAKQLKLVQENSEEKRMMDTQLQLLKSENQNIRAILQMRRLDVNSLESTSIYKYIHSHMKDKSISLNLQDWQELDALFKDYDNKFSDRLRVLSDLSFKEMRICYLVKLQVTQAAIARIMGLKPSTLNMTCKRIFGKLTCEKGTVEDFYKFIADF